MDLSVLYTSSPEATIENLSKAFILNQAVQKLHLVCKVNVQTYFEALKSFETQNTKSFFFNNYSSPPHAQQTFEQHSKQAMQASAVKSCVKTRTH